jgi:hypothetical protein
LIFDTGASKHKKKFAVFISSTFLDLRDARQEVMRAVLASDCIPAGMEFFPASEEELLDLIKRVVDDCDYYVLLVGGRYGSLAGSGASFTEVEFDYARRIGKPVLPFFHTDPRSLPDADTEPVNLERLERFKNRVASHHSPQFWSETFELRPLVQQALAEVKQRRPAAGWTRIESLEQPTAE